MFRATSGIMKMFSFDSFTIPQTLESLLIFCKVVWNLLSGPLLKVIQFTCMLNAPNSQVSTFRFHFKMWQIIITKTFFTDTSSIIFLDAADLVGFRLGSKNKFNLLIENVQEFFIKKDFMFATQKILDDTKVLISYRRGRFVKATFQTELDIKVSEKQFYR